MTYRYGILIYGAPINEAVTEALKKYEDDDDPDYDFAGDPEEAARCLGFETNYSAFGDDILGYIGEKIGGVEPFAAVPLQELIDTADAVTAKQKKEVQTEIDALPDHILKALPAVGVYIVWADS